MAWSVLQSASHAVVALTNPVTFTTANCTAGSTLIAYVAQSNATSGTVSSVKDGAGNSFLEVAFAVLDGNAGTYGVSVWALNTPAGDVGIKPTITATLNSSSDSAILVQEVAGIVTGTTLAALVDGTPGTIRGTAMGATGSPSYSSTASNEYLVAVYGDDGDGTTWTKPAALTIDAASINTSAANDLAVAYGNSTGTTEAGSWSLSGGTSPVWDVLLLAFKITGGAAPAIPAQPAQPGLTWRRHFRHPQLLVTPAPSGPQTLTGSAVLAGAGVVSAVPATPPPQAPPAAAAVYVTRKPPGRARVGPGGTPSGGIANRSVAYGVASLSGAGVVFAGNVIPPQRPQAAALVYVARKAPGRARVGRTSAGAGITGPQPAGTVTAAAALAGAGVLTAVVVQAVTATPTGAGVLSAAVAGVVAGAPPPGLPVIAGRLNLTRARTGPGTVAGGIAVRQPAGSTVTGAAAIAGAGVLTAAGYTPPVPQRPQASALAYVTRKPPGRARVGRGAVGGGITAAPPSATVPGAATLTGGGVLTASGYTPPVPQRPQVTALVYVTRKPPGRARVGRSAVAGGITGPVPAGLLLGTAVLAGAGTVTAAGGIPGTGAAGLAGAGTLTAVATQGGAAAPAGAGALTAAGYITGAANLAGAGALTARVIQAAGSPLAGAGTVTAAAVQQVTAVLAGTGAVSAASGTTAAFTVGTLTASAQPYASLTATTAPGAASGGTLTATDQRTGGPS